MKRASGPTKKLAPTIAPDTRCPHVFSDDDGIQLEIDCSECAGAHDLQNNKCLTGVVNVMGLGAEPETIILKRFIHKRYRGETVRNAGLLAIELAALRRGLSSLETPSDRRCRTCAVSTENTIVTLKRKLMESPAEYVTSAKTVFEEIKNSADSGHCGNARACVNRGLSFSTFNRGR